MKKNLIIMLLVSVVLVSSFVFAGITGYAVKQGDIQYFDDAQVDVIVKKVYRSGETEVLVTNDLGKTEVVIVPKNGTAKTSAGVEITVENAVRGGLFTKDVATVSVEALPVLSRFSGEDAVAGTGVGTGIHTHLVDYASTSVASSNINNINSNTFSSDGVFMVSVDLICIGGAFPINAGFMLSTRTILPGDRLPLMQSSFLNDDGGWSISFFDPDQVLIPSQSVGFVYCAKTEQAVNTQTAHFPF